MQIGALLGPEEFLKYQKIFNFGATTGIDLPGEATGILHTEESLSSGSTELASASFGQGYTCTMIQEIAAICSVINGGYYYQPHVVSKILNEDGDVIKDVQPVVTKQTVSSDVSALIRQYMGTVMESDGTGAAAKVDGYSMGGKTGTAQKYPREDKKYLVSFIGFAPLDDPQVMSLFQSTEALGVKPEDIGGTRLGSLGIPEFGTEFAMQMLIDTHPTHFSDLVRIAGLAHGTDVWLGNAQTLIQEGKATISTAICTRDDIMTYLIGMGLESEMSFKIMEAVRKGTVAKGKCDNWPKWKEEMIAHNVPDWYIWSCEKIKYMFPKAHAAAYVMMAWRIAWCKINYPLAYYAAYFSIRADAFNYELMCQGRERLERYMDDYKRRSDTLSQKEQETLKDMKSVQEMYARGFEFMKIDIYQANAHEFQIIDGKLMPSLSTIDGLGDKAADAFVTAAAEGPFLSRDDLRQRSKLSKTVIDLMGDLGLLDGLPESNQLSLFDFA